MDNNDDLENLIKDKSKEQAKPNLFINLLNKSLDFYFKPKFFEQKNGIYKWIGVNVYKKYLWKPFMKTIGLYYKINELPNNSSHALEEFIEYTKYEEAGHIALAGIVTLTLTQPTLINMTTTVLACYYPIAVQRYNRARITKILNHRKKRKITSLN